MKGVQKILKVPETFKGMKKIKEYPDHVLYEKTITDIWGKKHIERECFTYYDLGFTTKQIKEKRVHISNHF